jgi:hypothetical protein
MDVHRRVTKSRHPAAGGATLIPDIERIDGAIGFIN